MRKFLWYLCLLLPLGWVGLAVGNPDNDWFPANERLGWVKPGVPWLFGPSAWDWAGVGLLVLTGVGLALTQRRPSRRVGLLACGLGLVAIAIGYFGSNMAASARSELIAPVGVQGTIHLKGGLSETVLGYYYLTPVDGGQAAFADGSVRHITPEEFRAARKAEPPDLQPASRSPVKSLPTEPIRPAPGETEVQRKLRLAQERTQIGTDLKRMVSAHYYAGNKPPLGPDELAAAARLDERQRAALGDGTYVWYFGWSVQDLQSVEAERNRWRQMYGYDLLSWLGLHLSGLGVGMTLFGLIARARGRVAAVPSA